MVPIIYWVPFKLFFKPKGPFLVLKVAFVKKHESKSPENPFSEVLEKTFIISLDY